MSLPQGGAWPPPPHGIALIQQSLWGAWYIGDAEGLKAAYGTIDPSFGQHADFYRYENGNAGNLTQGGLINRVARYFWARPNLSENRKAGLHVPVAADIATASADLLFAEPPQFLVNAEEGGNQQAVDRVDKLLNDGDFHAEMIEAAEVCAALGGAWMRLVWDVDVADYVMIDSVSADSAIGEWRWGVLQAVTFFTEYAQGKGDQEVLRHLERHEPGAIYHGLYEGDAKNLGHAVPLTEHPDTAAYADLVNADAAIPTGVKGLTAAYVANMRPQRRWRKIAELDNLGRSDFDGVEMLMDALDEVYTSWMRDVRLGKARIIVPEFMLDDLGKGKGAAWDEDKEVYAGLKVAPTDAASMQITAQQFAIRVTEHEATAKALVDEVLRSAGYSSGTFGAGTDVVRTLTATEVASREKESDRTRDKKTRYWSQALEPLLTTWLELDALVFATGAQGEVELQWPDDSQPDPEALSRTIETLNRAVAVSAETKVRMLHPDWDEAQIAEEVAAIQGEQGMNLPDLGPLGTPPPLPAAGDGRPLPEGFVAQQGA